MISDEKMMLICATWKLDGDLMTCRSCKRSLIASRDGEPLRHRSDCVNRTRHHPLDELRQVLGKR